MKRALALVAFAGCNSEPGLISVGLATAPGSTLLDGVQTLRLEVTQPHRVMTAERSGDGFEISFETDAGSSVGALLVDGFDSAGGLIATGASPRFAFSGADGRVVIYMAAPDSVGVAPEALEQARSEIGSGLLPYGAIFAGGRGEGGVASRAIEIYNAYDHTLLSGIPLPAQRSAPAVGVGSIGVYIFGGRDADNNPSASLWRFDTTVQPAGQYYIIGEKPGFARAGETLVPLGNEQFLVTGTPAAQLFALDGSVIARDDVASLESNAVMTTANDGMQTAFFVGPGGIVRFRGGQFEMLPTPGRADANVVAISGGKVAIVCGGAEAQRIDAASATVEAFPGVPSEVKSGCAVAATSRHLLIAGGTTSAGVSASVEVYDAGTLVPLVTTTLAVPRTGATAVPLPNDQILIAGGVDATGAPVGTLELFTPGR